jgi:hypothetical protein
MFQWTWTHDLIDAARGLKALSITGYNMNWLNVQGPHTTIQGWPKLSTLHLRRRFINEGTITGILSAHEMTLTHVDLGPIQLCDGIWDAPIPILRNMRQLEFLQLSELIEMHQYASAARG